MEENGGFDFDDIFDIDVDIDEQMMILDSMSETSLGNVFNIDQTVMSNSENETPNQLPSSSHETQEILPPPPPEGVLPSVNQGFGDVFQQNSSNERFEQARFDEIVDLEERESKKRKRIEFEQPFSGMFQESTVQGEIEYETFMNDFDDLFQDDLEEEKILKKRKLDDEDDGSSLSSTSMDMEIPFEVPAEIPNPHIQQSSNFGRFPPQMYHPQPLPQQPQQQKKKKKRRSNNRSFTSQQQTNSPVMPRFGSGGSGGMMVRRGMNNNNNNNMQAFFPPTIPPPPPSSMSIDERHLPYINVMEVSGNGPKRWIYVEPTRYHLYLRKNKLIKITIYFQKRDDNEHEPVFASASVVPKGVFEFDSLKNEDTRTNSNFVGIEVINAEKLIQSNNNNNNVSQWMQLCPKERCRDFIIGGKKGYIDFVRHSDFLYGIILKFKVNEKSCSEGSNDIIRLTFRLHFHDRIWQVFYLFNVDSGRHNTSKISLKKVTTKAVFENRQQQAFQQQQQQQQQQQRHNFLYEVCDDKTVIRPPFNRNFHSYFTPKGFANGNMVFCCPGKKKNQAKVDDDDDEEEDGESSDDNEIVEEEEGEEELSTNKDENPPLHLSQRQEDFWKSFGVLESEWKNFGEKKVPEEEMITSSSETDSKKKKIIVWVIGHGYRREGIFSDDEENKKKHGNISLIQYTPNFKKNDQQMKLAEDIVELFKNLKIIFYDLNNGSSVTSGEILYAFRILNNFARKPNQDVNIICICPWFYKLKESNRVSELDEIFKSLPQNILICSSAGNTGETFYDPSKSSPTSEVERFVFYPTSPSPNVIKIGSWDRETKQVEEFSCRGYGVDVYSVGTSTSYSTIYTALMSCILWCIEPNVNNQQLKDIMIRKCCSKQEEEYSVIDEVGEIIREMIEKEKEEKNKRTVDLETIRLDFNNDWGDPKRSQVFLNYDAQARRLCDELLKKYHEVSIAGEPEKARRIWMEYLTMEDRLSFRVDTIKDIPATHINRKPNLFREIPIRKRKFIVNLNTPKGKCDYDRWKRNLGYMSPQRSSVSHSLMFLVSGLLGFIKNFEERMEADTIVKLFQKWKKFVKELDLGEQYSSLERVREIKFLEGRVIAALTLAWTNMLSYEGEDRVNKGLAAMEIIFDAIEEHKEVLKKRKNEEEESEGEDQQKKEEETKREEDDDDLIPNLYMIYFTRAYLLHCLFQKRYGSSAFSLESGNWNKDCTTFLDHLKKEEEEQLDYLLKDGITPFSRGESQEESEEEEDEEKRELFDQVIGNYEESINCLPNFTFGYTAIGVLHTVYAKNYEESLRYLNKSIEINPIQPESLLFRGRLLSMKFHRYEQAEHDLKKVFTYTPSNVAVKVFLIGLYCKMMKRLKPRGEKKKRMELIQQILVLSTGVEHEMMFINDVDIRKFIHFSLHWNRANFYFQMYNLPNAEKNELLEIIFKKQKQKEESEEKKKNYFLNVILKNLKVVLEMTPSNPRVYNLRGIIYHHLEEYELALEDFEACLQMKDPPFVQVWNNVGLVLEKMGKLRESELAFNKAIDHVDNESNNHSTTTTTNVLSNKAVLCFRMGKDEEGLKMIDRSIEQNKMNYRAYKIRGTYFLKKKDSLKAVSDFKHSLKINGNDRRLKMFCENLRRGKKVK